MTRKAFILLLCAVLAFAGWNTQWCTSANGRNCRTYSVSVTEDEEVLQNWDEEATVLRGGRGRSSSNRKPAPPPKVAPHMCASSCTWISTSTVQCVGCTYPWAIYPKSSSPTGNCIDKHSGLHMMRNSPETVYRYTQLCINNGKCNCSQTKYKASTVYRGRGSSRNRSTSKPEHCFYECENLGIQAPGHTRWGAHIINVIKRLDVRLHRDMVRGQCPTMATKAKFKFSNNFAANGELQSSLIKFCKFSAKQEAIAKFPADAPSINAWYNA